MQEAQGDSLDLIIRLARANQRTIKLHERHCPARQRAERCSDQDPNPVPFSEQLVPYDVVIEIIERMSTEGLTVYQASDEYGYTAEAIEMEVARQKGRYRQELLRRSAWRRPPSWN